MMITIITIITPIIIPMATDTAMITITATITGLPAITDLTAGSEVLPVITRQQAPITAAAMPRDPMAALLPTRPITRILIATQPGPVPRHPMAPGDDPWLPMAITGPGEDIDHRAAKPLQDLKPLKEAR